MRKVVSIVMALVLALTTLSVAAFAYVPRKETYDHVVVMGDSISAGYSLPDYVRHNKMILYDTTVEGAYPKIVADELHAKEFDNLAIAGSRAADFRYLLDENPHADWVLKDGSPRFSGGEISKEVLDGYRPMYQEKVADADFIILDVGYNNIWLPTITCIYDIAAGGRYLGTPKNLLAAIDKYGSTAVVIDNAMSYLRSWYRHPARWALFLAEWTSAVEKWMFDYQKDYHAVMKDIYRLNPDATVICSGMYNPFHDWDLVNSMDDNALEDALQPYINLFNAQKQNEAYNYKGNAIYVDMTGIPTISDKKTVPLYERMSTDDSGFNPHPTEEGHRMMAERVLKALKY